MPNICMRVLRYSALMLITSTTPSSYAADGGMDTPSMFSFNGFGTLGVVHSSEGKADFTSTIYKPNGAGYSHDWSFDVDSLVAAQVTANLTPKLSAVLQVVSEQNYKDNYRPRAEWANVKYQFTPDFSVRVGRSVLSPLLYSDTRLVTYSYPWVRPPREVYGLSPITNMDGVDISYRQQFGEWTNTFRAATGKSDTNLPTGVGATEVRNLRQIVDTIESGALTLHFSHQAAYLTIPSLDSLFGAFRLFGPQGAALADRYGIDHKLYLVTGIGASYDPGPWFLTSEWCRINTHSFIGKRSGWYTSGGYRFGDFTPYLTYAVAKADNLSDPGVAAPAAAGLNAALNTFLSSKFVQKTITVGGRWDFAKNVSLKAQLDHTDIGDGSTGVLSNPQPGFQTGGKLDVFSLAVDFVF